MCTERILVLTFLCVWGSEVTAIDGSDGYMTPDFCRGHKCPRYRVVEKHEIFEVREYEPTNWASTIVNLSCDYISQSDRLYEYIRGANEKGTKMDMTLPFSVFVPTREKTKKQPLSLFFLPSKFESPEPLDSSIYVYGYPALTWYIRSFDGISNLENCFNQAQVLAKELVHLKKPFDDTFFACNFYNGPYQLNNRHNEAALMLKHIEKSD
ncbi:heme-binding protein 2-like [Pelobates fuscus]|uniref:heme-binding protein 2-like n=1 Tax=Pelobates fuscus TaxID=191477 RepID=UPI002FE4A3C4